MTGLGWAPIPNLLQGDHLNGNRGTTAHAKQEISLPSPAICSSIGEFEEDYEGKHWMPFSVVRFTNGGEASIAFYIISFFSIRFAFITFLGKSSDLSAWEICGFHDGTDTDSLRLALLTKKRNYGLIIVKTSYQCLCGCITSKSIRIRCVT